MLKYPMNISFEMTATRGSWKGTFKDQNAKIDGRLIDPIKGIYRVIMKAPKPYPGPYPYEMPYDILLKWKENSSSASWYDTNIRGSYFPK